MSWVLNKEKVFAFLIKERNKCWKDAEYDGPCSDYNIQVANTIDWIIGELSKDEFSPEG